MRKVDEANTEAKRKNILRAAMRCFAQNGLQGTSIKDICKESGMKSGEKVVVDGQYKLQAGTLVAAAVAGGGGDTKKSKAGGKKS